MIFFLSDAKDDVERKKENQNREKEKKERKIDEDRGEIF